MELIYPFFRQELALTFAPLGVWLDSSRLHPCIFVHVYQTPLPPFYLPRV